MLKKRLIACLIVREGLIVQSIGFNNYLPIGRPKFPIEFVAKWDVDEIILLDISATAEGRSPDSKLLEMLSRSCFVPLTVGGGIRTLEDARRIIRAGADKVCINTRAIEHPELIEEIADVLGSQCVVVSMDCRLESDGTYQVYANSGRYPTRMTAVEWACKAEKCGAGEIFLNSIDRDGLKQGYDVNLIRSVTENVSIPVIACGGVGNYSHFAPGIIEGGASAVAAANIFHFIEHSTIVAKAHLIRAGVDVRLVSKARYEDREFDENGRLMMMSNEKLIEIEIQRGTRGLV